MRTKLFLLLLNIILVKAEVHHVMSITQIQNFTIPDLRSVCFDYNVTSASEECDEQLNVLCQNLTLLATMLDASSKFPYPGLSFSTRMDYGNFDQCMTIDHTYEGGRILGEHCTAGLIIPDIFGNVSDPNSYYSLAFCRPNGCTARDLNTILSNVIENFSLPLFQDLMCQTVETGTKITVADLVTITIITVCTLLMISSSLYDLYLHKTQQKCPNPLYLAFSVISNGKKLLHVTNNSKEQINTIQGFRVFGMMWILSGHGFAMWEFLSVSDAADAAAWPRKWYSGYITTARLAVDTFFFISGFLLAYQFLKQKPKPLKVHIMSIPQLYIHRYLRLTPALLMAFLVCISLTPHFGSGPLWTEILSGLSDPCRKYWWSFFLYIQNYYNYRDEDLCLVPTWYLSADMQLFFLSPLVMIPIILQLKKSSGFKLSMIQLLILNIFFAFFPMAIKLVFLEYTNGYDTHSRLINYFIGVMLALFMRVRQHKPFLYLINSKRVSIINLLIWILTLLGMLGMVIYYHYVEVHNGYKTQIVLSSIMRPLWCIGLSWIVYSCYHGYGGIVNWILSTPLFQVLGRLTYCIYLLHGIVLLCYTGTTRTKLYFSDYNVFYLFCGHYVVTLIFAVFWTLAFESPLIIIEKVIFGGRHQKREVVPPKNNGVEEQVKRGVK